MTRPVERFSPSGFFLGVSSGRGAVRSRSGQVTEAFTVETEGKLLTSRRALVVKESYLFESGRTDHVHWDLPHSEDELGLSPSEDRVTAPIKTVVDGLDLVLRFVRQIPGGPGRTVNLEFSVRFSSLQPGHAMSFATIRRRGFVVGSMVTFYERQ